MKRKTFLLVIGLFLYFCYSMSSFAYVYYIPHIHTGSDAWKTYILLDNSVSEEQNATIYYYDENGSMVLKKSKTVSPQGSTVIFGHPDGAIAAKVYTSSSFLRVRLGYLAKEELGGGTAEFAPDTKLYKNMIMNTSNYYDELTWSGFALWNATNKTVNVTLTAFSEEEELASKDITLQPYQKIVDYFDSFFGIDSFKDITTITVSADQEALTGVVISGKENDKLLFAPPRGYKHLIKHEEYLDTSYVECSNIVYTVGDHKYHLFISTIDDISENKNTKAGPYTYHISWNAYGPSDNFSSNPEDFGMYKITYLAVSEDGNSLYVFGINNDNKFVVKKVNVGNEEEIEWETVLGEAGYKFPIFPDPMDVKIRGYESSGKLFITYKDKADDWQGVTQILNASNGSTIERHGGMDASVQYGDVVSYSDGSNYYILISMAYYTDHLKCMIYNSDGSYSKQIYGETPIPDAQNKPHYILGTYISNGKVYMVVGVQMENVTGVARYQLYLVSVSLNENDFSNASTLELRTSLTHAASCYMLINDMFNETKDSTNTLEIITLPFFSDDFSKTIFVPLNENGDPENYISFIKPMPYRVKAVGLNFLGYYILSSENEYFSLSSYRIKLSLRLLWLEQMLNH